MGDTPTLQGRSVLVVENEPLIAMDIELALQRAGADVTTASTLQQALLLAEYGGLSAAILDYMLPDGDTSPLCARLNDRGVPFIIYTGFEKTERACRYAPHIVKPANPALLVDTMEVLLGLRST